MLFPLSFFREENQNVIIHIIDLWKMKSALSTSETI